MAESGPTKQQQDSLLAQDAGISDSQLKEFRMQLEQSLHALEQKARSSQRATIRAAGALVLCWIASFILNMGQLPVHVVGPIWVTCTWASLICLAVFGVRYWTQHRPALERGRIDLQIAMFNELQQQLARLAERIDTDRR
jgi:hypothetical protein